MSAKHPLHDLFIPSPFWLHFVTQNYIDYFFRYVLERKDNNSKEAVLFQKQMKPTILRNCSKNKNEFCFLRLQKCEVNKKLQVVIYDYIIFCVFVLLIKHISSRYSLIFQNPLLLHKVNFRFLLWK